MQAVTHYNDAKIIGEVSKGLGEAMVSYFSSEIPYASLFCFAAVSPCHAAYYVSIQI